LTPPGRGQLVLLKTGGEEPAAGFVRKQSWAARLREATWWLLRP